MVRSLHRARRLWLVAALATLVACAPPPDPRLDAADVDEYLAGPPGEPIELAYTFPGDDAPTLIQAEVYDGVVLIEGDIALGTLEELTTAGGAVAPTGHGVPTVSLWPATTASAPYRYEIPYAISGDFSEDYVEDVIEPALDHWNTNTNVRFVPWDGVATDYVEILSVAGRCWSNAGRQGGRQEIKLDEAGCTRVATVIHELGHTVGLKHEHQRPDRDQFVRIVDANIQTEPDRSGNFTIYGPGLPLGAYGYTSIMHYRPTAFGKPAAGGGQRTTIETLGPAIDPESVLTAGDLAGVRRLYPERDLPFADVTQPTGPVIVDEGDVVTFTADAVIAPTLDDRDLILSWSYDRNGVPFTFASHGLGGAATHRFCDGVHDVTVEAFLPGVGTLATDTVRVTVRDLGATNPPDLCGISVAIDQPLEGAVFAEGDDVALIAVIDDDHPETDLPLYPITWRLDDPATGSIVATGLQGVTKLGVGQQTIYVTYGSASDSVTVTVEESGTPPVANVTSPADGALLPWADYYPGAGSQVIIPVSGTGVDAEDGALSGTALAWSWRQSGASGWSATAATGGSTSVALPIVTGNTSFDLRLVVTDEDGFTGIDVVTITVQGPPS